MKLIKPYFEIIEQESGLEGIYKQIELAGRIGAHPQAAELADKLYIQFKEKNYI